MVRLCCLLLRSVVCGSQRPHCCVVCVCFGVLCFVCVGCLLLFSCVALAVCDLLCRAGVAVFFVVFGRVGLIVFCVLEDTMFALFVLFVVCCCSFFFWCVCVCG